jgi:hypothetical protein
LVASNEQIQQAIQASANAGAASGYAQALEDVVGNLDLIIANLDPKQEENSALAPVRSCQQEIAKGIRHNIVPELERRKAVAERELKSAAAHSQLVAVMPSWQVALVRRIIDASRLRPLLVQALGGAESGRPAQ